jgi:hypothetical protein
MKISNGMKINWKTIVVGMLVVSLTAGPLLISLPQKTEAGAESCLGGIIAGYVKSKVAGVRDMMGVPINSQGISEATANTAGQTQGFTIQRCIVEPLVTMLARTLLNKFTAQTVSWINSGFKGSPLYVTNLQGFMTDVADQTIGQFIEGLGPIGEFLCGPFDLQLRLSLNIEYGMSGYEEEIGCRLTDIQNNVNRAFTSGVFGKNGWDNWLQVTATPQNNPYGAYLKAVDSLDARIAGRQNIQLTQLGWGKGFLSSVNPETGEIETPGSLIEDQLAETLGQQVRNVGLARDLDAILNALVGQMINQVLGPGGLLGAGTKGSSSGGQQSAVDRGLYSTAENSLYENAASQKLPDGVLGAGQTATDFCRNFKLNLYFRNSDDDTIWFQRGSIGPGGKIIYTGTNEPAYKQPGNIPWTVTDFNNVVSFCNNVDLTVPVGDAANQFNSDVQSKTSGADTSGGTPPVEQETNLALRQEATQSSLFGAVFGPNKAVDGIEQSSGNAYLPAAYTNIESDPWWQVRLEKRSFIKTISIFKSDNENYADVLGQFNLYIDGIKIGETINTTNSSPVPIKITVNQPGQTVKIVRSVRSGRLGLGEVEVFGTQNSPTSADGSGGNVIAPAFTLSITPTDITDSEIYTLGSNFPRPVGANSFSITASQNNSNLKARISLFKGAGPWPVQLTSVFSELSGFFGNTKIILSSACSLNNCSYDLNPALSNQSYIIIGKDNLALLANQPINITPSGTISTMAIPDNYKLVTEIFDSSSASQTVIGSQTIAFTIR